MSNSKLAKNPLKIPVGVQCSLENGLLTVSFGTSIKRMVVPNIINLDINSNECRVTVKSGFQNGSAMLGTFASKLRSILRDIVTPYSMIIDLIGVGFKAFLIDSDVIVMSIGLSHLVAVRVPFGIKVVIKEQAKIEILGFMEEVTAFAEILKRLKPWDACWQSGVVDSSSFLRKKQGKKK